MAAPQTTMLSQSLYGTRMRVQGGVNAGEKRDKTPWSSVKPEGKQAPGDLRNPPSPPACADEPQSQPPHAVRHMIDRPRLKCIQHKREHREAQLRTLPDPFSPPPNKGWLLSYGRS
jgi:hypothetical protein